MTSSELRNKAGKLFLPLIPLCLLFISAFSQEKLSISGKVLDDATNEPLPNVNVFVKGNAATGTVSGNDGSFRISVARGATLVCSFIGYQRQEVLVSGTGNVEVRLRLANSTLNDVVVVGYGRQKKVNVTGAVSTVKSAFIKDRPVTDAAQALSGAASGVFVNQNSGLAGQDRSTIRIRGIGTLNNTNPLILVDGIEAALHTIDPNDIESISVLKDAASAAIYGSRASNGVILVTTKKGSFNRKPALSYSGYYGTSEATRLPEMVSNSARFMELVNEAKVNNGNPALFTGAQIDRYRNIGPNTDWVNELFGNGAIQQHNLTLSGGGESVNYMLSAGLLDQDAITPNTNNKRYNLRFNLESKVGKHLTIGSGLAMARGVLKSPSSDIIGTGGDGGVIAKALIAWPLYPVRDSEGRLAGPETAVNGIFYDRNPFTILEYNNFNNTSDQVIGNIYAEYEVIKGLKVRGTLALNHTNTNSESFAARGTVYDWITGEEYPSYINTVRRRDLYTNNTNYITSWLQASYEKKIRDHSFVLLLGASQESYRFKHFSTNRAGFPTNNVQVLPAGNASTAGNDESVSEWALRSTFGRLSYNFDNRYLMEFIIRRDGSSRFLGDNRYGVFPSVSAGWIVSRESFFKSDVIDLLKVKGSWGQLGNQSIDNNYPFAGQVRLDANYNFSGSLAQGAAQTTFDNPGIRWETTATTNIGLELGLFNQLMIDAAWFSRNTKDILLALPLPATAGGYETPFVNTGKVRNNGWEVTATYDKQFGEVRFSFGGNITHVTSRLEYLDPSKSDLEDVVVNGRYLLRRGESLNAIYGWKVTGIFQDQSEVDRSPVPDEQRPFTTPGDLKYADINNDGKIDGKDRVVLGQEDPRWLYGVNINIGYKGFDLSAIGQGTGDIQSYSDLDYYAPFSGSAGISTRWLNRWTPEHKSTTMPKLFFDRGTSNNQTNSFWVQNRAYFRVKNIQLGYTLPTGLVERIGLQKIRVYANAQNLFTITKFQGFDPERPEKTVRGGDGYPLLKMYTFGANVTF